MALSSTSKLVLAFVTLILGAVLIGTISTQALAVSEKAASSDTIAFVPSGINLINITEPLTVTNNPTSWKTTDCPLTNFAIANSSGTALTLTTDYTVTASTGVFLLKNSSASAALIQAPANNTYVTYNYCDDEYLNLGWGRTLIKLVAVFFALALLAISVGLFYSIAKDNGIA